MNRRPRGPGATRAGWTVLLAVFLAGCARPGITPAMSTPGEDNWPSFRGPCASGVADGAPLPDTWDAEDGTGVLFKTPIPGLAHSSPVIWGDAVYVTSALSSLESATFTQGLYGSGEASDDRSVHRWNLYRLDRHSGEIVWERTARKGVPIDKRHIKATYANSTPVTDGRYVVALFGSEGLFAYDVEGTFLWRKDLGRLDVGAYNAPTYEWGSASSPIIVGGNVIVQCDTQGDSFILAVDLASGDTVWRTPRDELPSWGTPTLVTTDEGAELVVNGSNYIRGYDPRDGKELWRLGGSSQITAPTPVHADGLTIVASGRHPERPIFAIRAGASGDITLPEGQTSSEWVAWSKTGRGPYMPTPLIYGDYVYSLNNNGVLDCYDLRTGEEIYRERVPHFGAGFSGSPVAGDGKLYLPAEDGQVFVIRAGPQFEIVARNSMNELLMATPAISGGTLYVRGEHHLFAIGGER